MALQWLRINGFSMTKDDLWILNMTASHSQNLHNVISGSAISGSPTGALPSNQINTLWASAAVQISTKQAGVICFVACCEACCANASHGLPSAKTIGQFSPPSQLTRWGCEPHFVVQNGFQLQNGCAHPNWWFLQNGCAPRQMC